MRALLPLLGLLLIGARPAAVPISYRLAPELRGDAIVALRVTARFAGDPSGVTRFDWADSWAGEDRLGQWARDLVVTGATATEPAPHGGRLIRAAPGAPLTVTYRVVSAYAADPTATESRQARPVVRPGWFYAVGEALFALPEGRANQPVSFAWDGPAGIGFASDLQHATARHGRTKTLDDLTESIVIGGRDLHVTAVQAGGAPLRVATLGRYDFTTATFEGLVARVVATERDFWGDRDRQPFLVTMAPLAPVPHRLSYSGTGRSDAFALWMDPGAALPDIGWLLGHEYFHGWNPRQLGRMPDGAAEPLGYWLSEGFTDFYARQLLLRAGLLTPDQFVASWNDALAAYSASRWRTAPDATMASAFWTDRAAEKLPYQRGAMLAAIWDRRLARASGGRVTLDTVIRAQRRRAAVARPALAIDLFPVVARSFGLDVRPDLARFVERGEAVLLPPDSFGRCARVETVTRPVFARGWDVDATEKAGNVVTGLDPASPAYAAGLRDGMTITGRGGGKPGDSTVDYVLKVSDAGAAREIRFRPAGKGAETVQRIVLDPTAFMADPSGCRAALAG